jgi:hypothetical protein
MIQLGIGAAVGFALGAAISSQSQKRSGKAASVEPLASVARPSFARFVALMACSPTAFKSSSGKLGAFQFSPKRLQDLGLVAETSRTSSPSPIWVAVWRPPFSEDLFLVSPKVQYAAFVKSCRKYLPIAMAHRSKNIDGKVSTLSGILGVLHVAGESGFASWFSDSKVRKRFTNTTSTFNNTNGVF